MRVSSYLCNRSYALDCDTVCEQEETEDGDVGAKRNKKDIKLDMG
jgi:hypothetical protein